MESIGYFFGRIFGGFIDRLSDQMRYKITNIAESKINETMEKPFSQSAKTSQTSQSANNQHTTNCRDRNAKS